MNIKKKIYFSIILLLVGLTLISPTILNAEEVKTFSQKLDLEETNKYLKALNNLRNNAGVSSLKLNIPLTKAAQNHLDYIKIHGWKQGEREFTGRKGFTGENVVDRVKYAGGNSYSPNDLRQISIDFVLPFESYISLMPSFLSYRLYLLSDRLTEVGIAYKDGTVVIIGYEKERESMRETVYPYNGQPYVNLGYNGKNDITSDINIGQTGHPITFQLPTENFNNYSVSLKNSKGKIVPQATMLYNEKTLVIFPKDFYENNEKYTVSVNYNTLENKSSKTKVWSFTSQINCSTVNTHIGQKVYWDGVELKSGQIGRLTVLTDTNLYRLDGDKKVFIRNLRKGEFYRIYAFKKDMLSVGGGYYVDRNSKVKYETPSQKKKDQLACSEGKSGF